MDDEGQPRPRAPRRRERRRAERVVDNFLAIQALRQQMLNNVRLQSESESESSGNVETSEEDRDSASENSEQNNDDVQIINNNIGAVGINLNNPEDVPERDGVTDSDASVGEAAASESDASLGEAAAPAELTDEEKEEYVIQVLREWATSGGVISMRKVDELLGKLSLVFKKMPQSYKTLLSSSLNLEIDVRDGCKFWYKGIEKNIDQWNLDNYLNANESIVLDISMDGLPLFKDSSVDSNKKFWPILGKLVGSEDDPFIIGIYCGDCDPRDIDFFLGQFVIEIDNLKNNGYNYNNVRREVIIRNFILDAPARALVKCCVGHGGYGACEKCTVVGQYVRGRVSFANLGPDCRPRSDESFARRLDRLHHCGRSPLELVGIPMVSAFRLDSMHLLYKGAFLRFMEAVFSWEGAWNLTDESFEAISAKLLSFKISCPRDFNRKPRKIQSYFKYKATELRRLLLYDGVVVFKDNLNDNIYKMFLLLHCAIYILASPYFFSLFSEMAELFLSHFVQFSAEVFGEHFVVYNIHSLLHLTEECRGQGTVDSFSAFPYENFLKGIKQTLRSGYLPLEQIAKRDSERRERREITLPAEGNSVEIFRAHRDENEVEEGLQFLRICVNKVTFKVGGRDSCFMTCEGAVVKLRNILQREENSIFFVGERFLEYDNMYTYPMDSARLGIMKVKELSGIRELFPLEAIFCKCWLMEDGDGFVSMPLLYSTPLLH